MAEPFMAEIRIVSFNFPPKNWAMCNGQLLPISQNQALFSLLGTTYGGNGQTTFALPDLRGCIPVHSGDGIVLGQKGGEMAHTLTMQEMPAHHHQAVASSLNATATTPAGNLPAASAANPYFGTPDVQMSPMSVSQRGGSQPHNNMSPYLVLTFIICLWGIYPSRN